MTLRSMTAARHAANRCTHGHDRAAPHGSDGAPAGLPAARARPPQCAPAGGADKRYHAALSTHDDAWANVLEGLAPPAPGPPLASVFLVADGLLPVPARLPDERSWAGRARGEPEPEVVAPRIAAA